jgi:NADP-dependent 3-hydroxy acid dehydrogenase YdfG
VFGVLNGIYAFLPRMLDSGEPAHIVNAASIRALGKRLRRLQSAIHDITETLHEDLTETHRRVDLVRACSTPRSSRSAAGRKHGPERRERSVPSRWRSAWTPPLRAARARRSG